MNSQHGSAIHSSVSKIIKIHIIDNDNKNIVSMIENKYDQFYIISFMMTNQQTCTTNMVSKSRGSHAQ